MLNIISGVDETNPQEIHNFASSIEETGVELQDVLEGDIGINSENMFIENENNLPITYGIIVDQDNISNVIMPENLENVDINEMGLELRDKKKCENTFLNGLEIDRGRVDSEKMSINTEKCLPITIDEKYIPTVIQGEIIPENSDKKKKSTRNVGRRKKAAK